MGSCKKDDYVEIDGVCPVVISAIPANGATDVPFGQLISVTFNEEMNSSTINQATFTLKAGLAVQGTITYQGTTATFTPNSPLAPNTTYTGRVTTGVKDKNGNALQTDYIWTFSTGNILSPLVILTNPANLESNVNINKVIMATFNMSMDALTINSATFKIGQGGTNIAGTISYTGATASFTPTILLSPNTTYTATITAAVKNPAGTPLVSNFVWTFTTGSAMAPMVISTDPSNNAVDVGLNKIITATFSEPLNSSSINTSSFTVRKGAILLSGTVTYSGSIASFAPEQPFLPGAIYTGTISKSVKNTSGISITEDYIWSFTTQSGSAPIVVSSDPAANEVNVAINKTVTATFSEVMNAATITNSTFSLKQGANTIAGTVTFSGTTASFDPTTNLLPGTPYTATITTGVKNGSGVPLANNYIWTFTTGTAMAPTVMSTDPANNATNVNTNKIVTATFSVPMDGATLNGINFTLKNGPNPILGTVTYSGSTISFNPLSNLSSGITYTATITTGVKNIAGTPLANDYVWTFSTGTSIAPSVISTDPSSNATGVSLSKTVSATFSTAMDQTTLNGGTFSLKNGATPVSGIVTYSGTTATFNPSTNLSPGIIYTATITTGAKNMAGTSLAGNYIWTFTTGAAVPPTIISTNPVNNEAGVSPNMTISVTFSELMEQATINGSTFILKNGANLVSGSVTYSGKTASFNPSSNLLAGSTYTVTITAGVKNLAGTALAEIHIWTFSTGNVTAPTVTSTDPGNNNVGVNLNKTITATFSLPMDQTSINTNSFTLKKGSNSITGVVIYSGSVASFNPSSDLEASTTYTATITNGALSAGGIPIANNYIWTFKTQGPVVISAPNVSLGSAGRFGILAGVGVSNNAGFSKINNMDVGISPGARSSVTGFPPATISNGAIFASDDASPPGVAAMLIMAKKDLTDAYLFAEGASSPAPATVSGDLGGKTLAPGIYKTNSTLLIQSGDLTLDAQGNANAVWIFQIGSGFTTVGGAGGSIILAGGASADNIFWQVGSSATIGNFTSFYGNVLALTSITMNSGATATGRMLCINGAVVMTSTNIINRP